MDSYTCACTDGFIGTNCNTPVDNCSPNPCQNSGTCANIVNGNGYQCPSVSTACTGGSTSAGNDTYQCTCPPGYTGVNCQTLIDNCSPNPCLNSGVCTNGVDSYTCACANGFLGTNCDTAVDNCASTPCQNGGECANLVSGNGYHCPTVSGACAGDSTSIDTNTYNCNCSSTIVFDGRNCTDVTCNTGNCVNGEKCTDQSNQCAATSTFVCATITGGFLCQIESTSIRGGCAVAASSTYGGCPEGWKCTSLRNQPCPDGVTGSTCIGYTCLPPST